MFKLPQHSQYKPKTLLFSKDTLHVWHGIILVKNESGKENLSRLENPRTKNSRLKILSTPKRGKNPQL